VGEAGVFKFRNEEKWFKNKYDSIIPGKIDTWQLWCISNSCIHGVSHEYKNIFKSSNH
jgi:hypothetical protein